MAHALHQAQFTSSSIKFKPFSKYDFVKSFVAASIGDSVDLKTKEQEEKKAAIIADAIEETQAVLLESLATKEDIKILEKDIKALEKEIISSETRLTIKVAVIVGGFLTIAPLLTDFIRHLFKL